MQPIRVVAVVLLVGLSLGCNDKPPTGPSPPATPTVTGLAVSGADAVLTGASASYTATASFSDGTTRTVTPAWTSSDPGVGTVDSTGRLDGRAHGPTTLSATYLGRDATKTVRVVNDYGGNWEGLYGVTQCHGVPFHGSCNDVSWAAFSVSLAVSHDGDDPNAVTATLRLPSFFPSEMKASIGGRVTADGALSLAGSSDLTDRNGRVWATFHVEAWDTTLRDGAAMTGRWVHRRTGVPADRPPFSEYQEVEIERLTRYR